MVLNDIVSWGDERGITEQYHDAQSYIKNIVEELGELIEADKQDDTAGVIDAMCDIIVFSVTEMVKLNINPEAALEETVKEISSRTGAWNQSKGKWVKDTTDEAKARWYTADYGKATMDAVYVLTYEDLLNYFNNRDDIEVEDIPQKVLDNEVPYKIIQDDRIPKKVRKLFKQFVKTDPYTPGVEKIYMKIYKLLHKG